MINLFINEPRRDLSTDWIAQGSKPMVQQDSRVGAAKNPTTAVLVARDDQMKSAKDFEMIVRQSQPVILTGLDLGPCITSWTIPYLEAKIGGDRNIIVHEATDALLDFRSKNFQYAKKRFKDFIEEIATGSRQYLRSLSWENPAGRPADISVDFPDLASDFRLPPQLDVVRQNMHSSVLRISGPVTMWLHYDV